MVVSTYESPYCHNGSTANAVTAWLYVIISKKEAISLSENKSIIVNDGFFNGETLNPRPANSRNIRNENIEITDSKIEIHETEVARFFPPKSQI